MNYKASLFRIIAYGIWTLPVVAMVSFLYANFKYYRAMEMDGRSYYSLYEYYLYYSIAIAVGLILAVLWRYFSSPKVTITDEEISVTKWKSSYSLTFNEIKEALYRPRRNRLWSLVGVDGIEIYIPDGYISKSQQEQLSQLLLVDFMRRGISVRLS